MQKQSSASLRRKLLKIYDRLYSAFGPQYWWPGQTKFEIMVGAILAQNTNWQNVERAIDNLKREKLLHPKKLHKIQTKKLAQLIKSAGYYNVKAKRLKEFIKFLFSKYNGNLKKMPRQDSAKLRKQLLEVHGIGQETADSILLYAANKPVFVVDAYTKRILSRHKLLKKDASYEEAQGLFMDNLRRSAKMFNEYHALLVQAGKRFCKRSKPLCHKCPLQKLHT